MAPRHYAVFGSGVEREKQGRPYPSTATEPPWSSRVSEPFASKRLLSTLGYCASTASTKADDDGGKRVYHINAVDCVTQCEIVATCERLSEAYLVPVIKAMLELEGFPFTISGFHADNGSECIIDPGREHPAEDGPGDVGRWERDFLFFFLT
jgi:hypothetical protein